MSSNKLFPVVNIISAGTHTFKTANIASQVSSPNIDQQNAQLVDVLTIKGSNIGIGTTVPLQTLHINSGNLIMPSGSIGINTNSPQFSLDVEGGTKTRYIQYPNTELSKAKLSVTSNDLTYLPNVSSVSNWNGFLQSTAANQPIYNTSGGYLNGSYVSFNKTNSTFLSYGTLNVDISTNGGLTVFIVAKFDLAAASAGNERLFSFNNGTTTDEIRALRSASSNALNFAIYNSTTLILSLSIAEAITQNQWGVYSFRYNNTTLAGEMKANLNTVVTGNASATATNKVLANTYLGRSSYTTNSDYLTGGIATFLFYDKYLSDSEFNEIEKNITSGVTVLQQYDHFLSYSLRSPVVIKNSGKVGIGTSHPLEQVEVDGNVKGKIFIGDLSGNASTVTSGVYTSRVISTGTGLTGGGNLSADRTISLIDISAGSTTIGALTYNGTTQSIGRLYGGTTNPTNTARLNYDGYLYATKFVGDVSGNVTSGTVAVSNGGTGNTSLTANKVLVGNGTNSVLQPTNLHWDNTNFRLGIYNTSPANTLDVSGNARFTGDTLILGATNTTTTYIQVLGSSSAETRVYAHSDGKSYLQHAGDLFIGAISSSSNPRMYVVAGTGNVGIGKNSASYKLDVSGNIKASSDIQTDGQMLSSTTDSATAPGFTWSGDTNTGMFHAATDTIGFTTNGVERIRIDSSGNVGIGSVTPKYILDVSGNIRSTANALVDGNVGVGTTNPISKLHVYETNGAYPSALTIDGTGGRVTAVHFTNTDGYNGTYWAIGNRPSDNNNLYFATNIVGNVSSYSGSSYANAAKVTFKQDGNVGIGTISPAYALDVNYASVAFGSGTTAANIYMRDIANASWQLSTNAYKLNFLNNNGGSYGIKMVITNDGNVGIGSATPGQKLDVTGNIRSSSQFISTVASGTAPLQVTSSTLVSNLNADYLDGLHNSSFMRTDANTSTTGTISLPDGSENAPSLTFTADTNTGLYRIGNDILGLTTGGTERVRIDAGGNVGIAKSSATQALDVSGNVKANLFIGDLSGNASTVTNGVYTSRNIATGTGLTGGGNLSSDRTISLIDISAGSITTGALAYNGTTQSIGKLYGGSTNPSNTTRLNYDGYLYATRFVGDVSGNADTVTNGVYTTGNQSISGIKTFNNNTTSTSTTTGTIVVTGGVGISENLNVGGNLALTGNLTVNGTTTTVNSTTVTVDDPIITLGGDTAPVADDNKDKGVEFRYYDTAARIGFFGFDDSTGYFTFLKSATNTSEVFSGTVGDAQLGTLLLNDGTVSAPSITFSNDTNTGLYRIGNDVMGFTTAGTERLRIDSTGNVGIGTNLPVSLLHVGTMQVHTFTRTLGTTLNNATEICTVTATAGAYCLELNVVQSESSNSECNAYIVAVGYNSTNATWRRLLPTSRTGNYLGNDFDVDINSNNNTTTLRLVRTGTAANVSSAGFTCTLRVSESSTYRSVVAPSTTTSTGVTVGGYYESTSLTQVDGNVGIGTNLPAYPLDVNGNIRTSGTLGISDGTVSAPAVYFNADANTGLYRIGNDVLGLTTNGTERLRIDSAGNVGIGTNNAFTKLYVNGTQTIDKDGEALVFNHPTAGGYSLVRFNSRTNFGSDCGFILVEDETPNSSGTGNEDLRMTIGVFNDFRTSTLFSDELWFQGGGRLVYNVGAWDASLNAIIGTPGVGTAFGGPVHEWRVGNSPVMVLDNSGNLGIGVTAPSSMLHVAKSVTSGVGPVLLLHNPGAGGASSAIDFHGYSTSGVTNGYAARIAGTDDSNYSAHLTFSTKVSGGLSGALTERMRISSAGNVGIGTNVPVELFHVRGKGLIDNTSTAPPANGTTGSAGTRLVFWPGNGSTVPYSIGIDNATLWFATSNNSYFKWYEGTTERMRIHTGGNVGIGTNFPIQQLDVSGNINFSGSLYKNGSLYVSSQWSDGSNNSVYYNSGNVGIGTVTTNASLDVNGLVYLGKGLYNGANNSYNGGPYYKQTTWDVSGSTHTIAYPTFCIGTNSSGTLHIQVNNKSTTTPKIGNLIVSFIVVHNTSTDVFVVSSHKNGNLSMMTVTNSGNDIVVTTDSDCRVSWTSIGSF